MSIRIEPIAKVTVTPSLVSGGSLAQNTDYYITLMLQRETPFREGTAISELADEVQITTDTTNLSISLAYIASGTITTFADAGDGKVYVTSSENHCLKNGNSITISGTTNYNGTYTITYDGGYTNGDTPVRFKITETWAGDDATGSWECSDNIIGQGNKMNIRCATSSGLTDGEWDGDKMDNSDWSHRSYTAATPVQGYTLTSKPTESGVDFEKYIPVFRKSSFPATIIKYDRPFFKVIGNDTWDNWITAMQTYIPNNINYWDGNATQNESLYFSGHLAITALTTTNTITSKNITIDGCMDSSDYVNNQTYLIWSKCFFKFLGSRRPDIIGTFNDSLIRAESADSPAYYFAVFDTTIIDSKGHIHFYGTTNGVLNEMDARLGSKSYYFWYVYPRVTSKITNLKLQPGYLYFFNSNVDATIADDNYFLENVEITSEHATYDINFYQTASPGNVQEFLNVTAPNQTNDKVRVYKGGSTDVTAKFMFTTIITVVDDAGDVVVGATVTLTDKDATEYSDTTDANGEVTLYIKSYDFVSAGGTDDFNPFTLEITKTGYEDYVEAGLEIYGQLEKTIALIDTVINLVYVYNDQNVSGSVSSSTNVSGTVQ